MVSGHLQGRLLAALTRLVGAKRVLEIGTFTGYAALCFAEGVREVRRHQAGMQAGVTRSRVRQ
jgi:predicted O-methyltransferase YrrM